MLGIRQLSMHEYSRLFLYTLFFSLFELYNIKARHTSHFCRKSNLTDEYFKVQPIDTEHSDKNYARYKSIVNA